MVAINNLNGNVKGVEGKVIYREQLPENLLFVVVKKYLPIQIKDGVYAFSSKFQIDCGICKNQIQDTGSIHYFHPSRSPQPFNQQLREFKTKDGFVAREYDCGICETNKDNKPISKITEFAVEVPESFILGLLKNSY